MALKLANNAVSRLASPITASSTTIALTPGDGAKFPTLSAGDWFPITVVKSDGTLEIMRCTARTNDTLTVTRAQEGTAAVAFAAGDRVELRLTAAACDEIASIQDSEVTTSKLADGVLSANAAGRAKMADQFVTFLKTAPDLRAFLVPTGGMIMWTKSTVPTGFVEANGAALPIASYQDLANAMYVGDANNATAPAWYKCTNPSNPSGSRSTSGSYIVVPDYRGEFIRGWDHGRGVDPGRALGSSQSDQNKAHNHGGGVGSAGQHSHSGTTSLAGSHAHSLLGDNSGSGPNGQVSSLNGGAYGIGGSGRSHGMLATNGSGAQLVSTADNHIHTFNTDTAGGHVHTIASDGGTEARPRNVAVMFIIKT